MFTKLMNWWNKDKIELETKFATIQQKVEVAAKAVNEMQEKLEQAEDELSVYRSKDEADKARFDSVEPWIEIKSDGIDPIRGMVIECDWNPAFIQFLKENGITAKDEETAVQKYIALLYEDIVNKMEQKVIDGSDKPGRVSDFA